MPPDEAQQQQQQEQQEQQEEEQQEQQEQQLQLHSSRDNLNEIYVETTYAEFTITTRRRAQTSRGLVGVLAACGKQKPLPRQQREREGGREGKGLRQLSAVQPSRTRTHCARSLSAAQCVYACVAACCTCVCNVTPRSASSQGHVAVADADGHARNAVAAFIELAPDFLWAILLLLTLSLSVSPLASPSLLSIGSCHCGRVLKVTRTHARCTLQLRAASRSTQASNERLPYATQHTQNATRNLQQCGAVGCRS